MGDKYVFARIKIEAEHPQFEEWVELQQDSFYIGNDWIKVDDLKDFPTDEGLFCFKLPDSYKEHRGTIKVALTARKKSVDIICEGGAVLFIGKSNNIKKRIRGIFSARLPSNFIGRKLSCLLNGTKYSGDTMPEIDRETAEALFKYIEVYCMLEPCPIKRELKKSHAIAKYEPCLNIGFEH